MQDCIREIIKAKRAQTLSEPFYVFDLDRLKAHVDEIQKRFADNMTLCYAIKANPFLIAPLDAQLKKYEVCSPGELDICLHLGIDTKKIVFSGVNKRPADIAKAIEVGVGVVTLESYNQYLWVKEYVEEHDTPVTILPRLSNGFQFGMSEEELEDIVAHHDADSRIHLIGVQFFTGTQKKLAKTIEEIDYIVDLVGKLEQKYNYHAEQIEYGAGIKVAYFEGEDLDHPYDELDRISAHIGEKYSDRTFIIELGRYVAAYCGYYATSVTDTKINGDRRFALVDGGMNHVNYYGQNMAMRVPEMTHDQLEVSKEEEDWTIVGSLCTFADILIRKAHIKTPKIGDILIFHRIGAYSVTEGIYLFLSRRMPEIYYYSKASGMKLIREGIESSSLNGGK
ncbi:MAG: alanine racemase [Lachnospiraceae bacterium]|nr:alanine racemase [Lachnospiraceae bacterium]